MPHLIVEYSDNLGAAFPLQDMLAEMHDALDGQYNVAKERIKTRAVRLTDYIVGLHGQSAPMIHITLKLMQGRTPEAQKELALLLQSIARRHVPQETFPHAAITAEIVELATATYCP